MKYTATLKTLKQITGIDCLYCKLIVTQAGYERKYLYSESLSFYAGKRIEVKQGINSYLFFNPNGINTILPSVWLTDIEPIKKPVDWSKIKVDAKVIVWDNQGIGKAKRHFAKYECGQVYTYPDGLSSWTVDSVNNCCIPKAWDNAELIEDENP